MKGNMTTETILASVTRTFPAPAGYSRKSRFTVTAQAYQLNDNKHPHFSITGEIGIPGADDCEACGCLHDDILKAWPEIKPLVDLHLSNADDGAPMHAEANGWYWMAGALGGAGEKYHGGADKSPDQCLAILADHLRVSLELATMLRDSLKESTNPKAFFGAFVEQQRERWEQEAKAGIELIKSLALARSHAAL